MEFRALGPLQVMEADREVIVEGRIRRRLLSMLLLHAGRHVDQERLERAAWGDDPPETARRVIQSHLSRLRAIGLDVKRAGSGYLLDVSADAVDAHRFRALAEGSRLREASSTDLREALAWWRGDPWPDLAEVFPVADHRELFECRAAVRERLALIDLLDGCHRTAATEAEAAVRDDPRREISWALWAAGVYCEQRRTDALRVLHDARRSLGAAGLDLGPVARDLEGWIVVDTPGEEVIARLTQCVEAPVADRRAMPVRLPVGLRDAAIPPFGGRRAELGLLCEEWTAVFEGTFRVVLLSGEPGAGKSRLARELAVSLHGRGVSVIHGTCDSELDAPFQPVLEALREAAASLRPSDARRLFAPFARELSQLCPDLVDGVRATPADHTDPESERFRAISSLTGALGVLASGPGLLMVLDDLQWCDAGTGQVLRRLVREQPAHMMVVGTYRDTERHGRPAWTQTLSELLRHPVVRRWPLEGLDTEAVRELIESCGASFAVPGTTTSVAQQLVELTGGNALFVAQLLQQLVDTHSTVSARRGWQPGGSLADLAVPEGVRDVVEQRIAAAHERGVEVLEAAAVVGHRFTSDQLRSLVDDETLANDVTEAVVSARLLSELGAGRFQFAHALIRGALLERMSGTRRAQLHLQVVQAIDDEPAVCASHWEAAADLRPELLRRSVDCYVEAGDRAMELRSPDTAVPHFERALELGQVISAPIAWSVDVGTRLGAAERQIGATGHRRRLSAIARQAVEAGMTEAAAEAVLATYNAIPSRYLHASDAMLRLLDDILDRADELPDVTRAAVFALRATEVLFTSDGDRRRAATQSALDAVERCTDPVVEARALSAALLMYFTEELFDRPDIAARLDRLCTVLPPRDRVVARASLIQLHVSQGNMAGVLDWAADARKVSADLGEPELRCYFSMVEVQLALLSHGVDTARRRLDEMAALAAQSNSWMARMPEPFGWTVDIFAGEEVASLATAYDAGIAVRPDLPLLRATAAYTSVRSGRRERALEHLDALADSDFDARSRSWGYAAMLVLSALTAAELQSSHRDRLRDLLVASRTVVPLQPMPHDTPAHAIGVIDASLGAHESAVEQFERALEVYSSIGAPLFAARTEASLARCLAARRAPGDIQRARSLVQRVRSAVERCGLGDLPDLSEI